MSIPPEIIAVLAARLHRAAVERHADSPLSDDYPMLVEGDAYDIQAELLRLTGGVRTGYKLGFTSAAMRAQMGVDHPNSGVLLDHMRIIESDLPAGELIQPRVEPEIAIQMGRDLRGTDVTPQQVADAAAAVLPAIEVVDSRYRDYRFKSVDNIADNSSAARYVLGAPCVLARVGDLRRVEVQLASDGQVIDQGAGAAALDSPLAAVAWLARHLAGRGEGLLAGEVVLTGGLTRAHALPPDSTAEARFSAGLGTVTLRHR